MSACRAASAQPAPEAPKADASRLKVGLAYDIGGRGDASFNDAAAAGLDRAVAELGLQKANTREATAQAGESEDAGTNRLRQLAQGGFNPIVAVGFNPSVPPTLPAALVPWRTPWPPGAGR